MRRVWAAFGPLGGTRAMCPKNVRLRDADSGTGPVLRWGHAFVTRPTETD
jgi:hypothetical protein